MAGLVVSVRCPSCKKNYITRIRWGEESEKQCPDCGRGYTPDQHKLSEQIRKELKDLGVDSELDVME